MSGKHTPGPWVVRTAGHGAAGGVVVDELWVGKPAGDTADDIAIASDIRNPYADQLDHVAEANAALIAAAPDLLEACKRLEMACMRLGIHFSRGTHEGKHTDEALEAINQARAAIAKAEGRQL